VTAIPVPRLRVARLVQVRLDFIKNRARGGPGGEIARAFCETPLAMTRNATNRRRKEHLPPDARGDDMLRRCDAPEVERPG
jgi:hypothetical protein